MNERIEQLAIECYQVPEFDYKKFAQLIVAECMQIANTYQNRGGNIYVDNKIAEHFGVEE